MLPRLHKTYGESTFMVVVPMNQDFDPTKTVQNEHQSIENKDSFCVPKNINTQIGGNENETYFGLKRTSMNFQTGSWNNSTFGLLYQVLFNPVRLRS